MGSGPAARMLTAGADREVRLVDGTRGAVRPFRLHRGRVRALEVVDPHVFLSGSDDGTVCSVDVRAPPRSTGAGPVVADQRGPPRGGPFVRVHAVAVDGLRPWLVATGGSDPIGARRLG